MIKSEGVDKLLKPAHEKKVTWWYKKELNKSRVTKVRSYFNEQKHVFIIIGVILCIRIVATVIYLKVKYDEKRKTKAIYYKEQQERITLYLKHNTKEPNTIKSVHFTSLKTGPMGDAVIEGYINENKKLILLHMGLQNIIINLVEIW